MQDSHSLLSRFKSLSGIAVITGFLLVVAGPGLLWTDWLNNQMFRVGTLLLPKPESNDSIRLIQLPADAYSKPEGISRIRHLLKKLDRADAAGVAVVLKPLPSLDYQLKQDEGKATSRDEQQDDNWELTRGELNKLAWSLQQYEVNVGIVTQPSQTDYYSFPAKTASDAEQTYLDELERFKYSDLNLINQKTTGMHYSYPRYPVSVQLSTVNKPLIWFEAGDFRFIPDLVLRLYAHLQPDRNIDWIHGNRLQLATQVIRTDDDGMVLEYYSALTQNHADIKTLSLDRALSVSDRQFANKLVIIADDSYHLNTIGNSLANLVSGTTYHEPVWSDWLTLGGGVFIMLFTLLVLPRVSRATGYLLSFIVLLVGLISQYVLLIVKGIWVPLLGLFVYLLFAHFIMQLKRINDARMDHLRLLAHEAFWHLGQYQYEQGDHEKALPNLLKCKPTSDVVELLYEIALGFERRRQYDRALQLYSDIDVRRANYRDVRKRLQSLTSVATQVQADPFKPGQTTRTLVLPDLDIELPTLGRYELEKELGRGAMGVVYLGKDPRINRQVAIKTLDYSQFSSKEIKSIKSRFFREAEAAGRLSHPNIVTVYDVGDEEDFAFIAMDYVPGVSLGEYTQADHLLPVAEVYRLIAEVAETLDYAHSQKIVHRDIKPSNIMYNPENGQFKVTDFGIARITDSVRTRTGSFMGSPSYMSPEQMTGSRVDGKSDIYALGVSFYQLLTGVLPFQADNLGNLAYKITHEKHRPIRDHRPDLPASATRIVNKCLQKKPENRYKDGHEMAVALKRGMPRGGEA